ncbi:MAG: flotillin-like FloA family protein, partial [Candidatus Latescibacterota bacterium]|nr:flotillin-like FloA family protein [Candidatus Latescibacterota bacterium]
METLFYLAILFAIIIFVSLFTYFVPIGLWVTAYFSGVKVSIFRDLVGMRLRKVPPGAIVRPKISAEKAGIEVPLARMEAHFLAGGHVELVILALISADKANIELTFERAAAIDLAG